MRYRKWTFSTALLLGALMSSPADARGVWFNASGRIIPGDDASVCVELRMAGPITGVLTGVGLVRTERPTTPVIDVQRRQFSGPTDHVNGHKTFSTVYDYVEACLDGVGRQALGGYAVFTLNAHGSGADVVEVLVCSYSKAGASCA